MKKHGFKTGFAILGATLALGSVQSARAEDPTIPGPNSFVRFGHYLVKGDKVDVFVDGDKKLNDVGFDFLSKYLRVASGTRVISIKSNNPTRTLFSVRRTLRPNEFYSGLAYGTRRAPRLSWSQDSAGNPPFGRAQLAAYHLSPGSPPVDVVGYSLATGRKYVLLRNLRYGRPRVVAIPTGPMTVKLVSRGVTLKTVTGASPRAGRKYALYATGAARSNFKVILDTTATQ